MIPAQGSHRENLVGAGRGQPVGLAAELPRGIEKVKRFFQRDARVLDRGTDDGLVRAARVSVSSKTLEEDIAEADVLLFTYSTVAEEAFLKGKPVWQWLPLSYNASALVEACAVPQFSSTDGLRQALKDFQENPKAFQPELSVRKDACEKLFFRGDGLAAARIAQTLSQ